ncbi:MAG: helix-turn-helix transcriptional regulator [Chitinophagaceae bacterium]|nr:helix-turn-helix transcriptional regulator [Chitinophagaceae bacterium]
MANTSKLSAENGEPFVFVNNLPDNYNGPMLAGAVCYSARSSHSELVLQELQGDEYGIRLLAGKFLKKLYAKGWIHTEGLYSCLMLKNNMRKKMVSLGETHLREGQYCCFYTQPSDCCSFFEEGKEFRMFDLFYSPLLLEELVPVFPKLKSVVGADPGTLITLKPFWLPLTIRDITNQILRCPYDETTRQFYFDIKVKELLYCMLENVFKQDADKLSFTPWEIDCIHEARKILKEHISSKPPSIRKLAKLVALNEYKLKKGFHQYFHTSIGQWMQEEKLQYSRELLLNTNKPIKEISHLVGYPLTTNFITAFRKHFGVTPGDLRRK